LQNFKPVISNIILSEIHDTPDKEKRRKMRELVQGIEVLVFDEEADKLARDPSLTVKEAKLALDLFFEK